MWRYLRCSRAPLTDPGDLIFDSFAGSGTTGVAALIEQCRVVGAEIGSDWDRSRAHPSNNRGHCHSAPGGHGPDKNESRPQISSSPSMGSISNTTQAWCMLDGTAIKPVVATKTTLLACIGLSRRGTASSYTDLAGKQHRAP
ncbi:TPA: hypothetical protein RJR39_001086 [Burkholderia cenocepacia]|uniref:DNA methyltransferase n=1 Tax=Burkholderia cenocepacia TaxID=95486 RepID=UPI001BA05DF5|nr:hypothetical protein [Burkholderia cenocepacia]HDV6325046.1 hypothetical protein [Burkholderia cenocepacia]HDV6353115.1 hypothetical protein [Burkholderia cenocepacia]